MLENTYKTPKQNKAAPKEPRQLIPSFLRDRRLSLIIGFFMQGLALFLTIAFISHFVSGAYDQSIIQSLPTQGLRLSGAVIRNWLGLLGALGGYYFVFKWFGITAFFIPLFLYLCGHRLIYQKLPISLYKVFNVALFSIFWFNVALGYVNTIAPQEGRFDNFIGGIGFELAPLLYGLLGEGVIILLLVAALSFLTLIGPLGSLSLPPFLKKIPWFRKKPSSPPPFSHSFENTDNDLEGLPPNDSSIQEQKAIETLTVWSPPLFPLDSLKGEDTNRYSGEGLSFTVVTPKGAEEDTIASSETFRAETSHAGNYDPTLDLSNYHYPTLDLLKQHSKGKIEVTKEELDQNKDKIVETLTNFKIGIASIKATIGPTVTLYEIVPQAGVKISRIKNLEDDIALNLAALGIRIIAPIPGEGTIGIEVPNKHREVVPFRAIVATDKFMKSSMDLPVIMGKSISNEVIIKDLASMPHLLIAGATGQGKSVGLNVVLASLLYKKHPSQLKFVLVDPKKVELSLYNKIERHFLAKLPNNEEAIITATKEVVHTLNSLCIEMDTRYELLKEAGTRNIKEYNEKFVQRKLNPEEGHRFLPYIVLVVDEFADMMMTAGKEVEAPIARLAQLARAIGIHLVLATQRPSVNVITGIIKANFPVRLSFRVMAKVDSRTILDTSGAEQLVGQGDMLLSMNSEVTRLQCPFIDTEEVNHICDYIGAQRGYPSAYMLPVYEAENEQDKGNSDLGEKDPLFDEAARLVVAHQQGSTSLIQRKLKLGYNRAGRLIDQLEAAGIVGSFEGSKAREVLVHDLNALDMLLTSLP